MSLMICTWLMMLFHPFYVSVTEINHNASEQTLEISVKIFTDDFENALKKEYGKPVDLIKPSRKALADSLVADYLKKNLRLKANGKVLQMEFLGYENEMEAVWSYFEIKNVPAPNALEINNTILYNFLNQQINMVHATVGNVRRSGKLDYPESKLNLRFR